MCQTRRLGSVQCSRPPTRTETRTQADWTEARDAVSADQTEALLADRIQSFVAPSPLPWRGLLVRGLLSLGRRRVAAPPSCQGPPLLWSARHPLGRKRRIPLFGAQLTRNALWPNTVWNPHRNAHRLGHGIPDMPASARRALPMLRAEGCCCCRGCKNPICKISHSARTLNSY